MKRELPLLEVNELDRVKVIKAVSDMITDVAVIRDKQQANLENFIKIPSSPSTDARLRLEEIGGMSNQLNKRVQVLHQKTEDLLKIVRERNQSPSD